MTPLTRPFIYKSTTAGGITGVGALEIDDCPLPRPHGTRCTLVMSDISMCFGWHIPMLVLTSVCQGALL